MASTASPLAAAASARCRVVANTRHLRADVGRFGGRRAHRGDLRGQLIHPSLIWALNSVSSSTRCCWVQPLFAEMRERGPQRSAGDVNEPRIGSSSSRIGKHYDLERVAPSTTELDVDEAILPVKWISFWSRGFGRRKVSICRDLIQPTPAGVIDPGALVDQPSLLLLGTMRGRLRE